MDEIIRVDLVYGTFASSRFFIVLCMGLRASLASLAGMMSLRSMSLTSSIMSVFSSEKASCRAATRSRVGWGVSTATWELRPPFSAPNGLKMVYMCSIVASWWLRMLVQASRHCLEDSSSCSSQCSWSMYVTHFAPSLSCAHVKLAMMVTSSRDLQVWYGSPTGSQFPSLENTTHCTLDLGMAGNHVI